jgi:hypothetical protein
VDGSDFYTVDEAAKILKLTPPAASGRCFGRARWRASHRRTAAGVGGRSPCASSTTVIAPPA